MNCIMFDERDVEILYSIPKSGADLTEILRWYILLNRAAQPSFPVLQDCFRKASIVGCLKTDGKHLKMEREWFERIHAADETASNEIESLIEFQDGFAGKEVPAVQEAAIHLSEKEYDSILQDIHLAWNRLISQSRTDDSPEPGA